MHGDRRIRASRVVDDDDLPGLTAQNRGFLLARIIHDLSSLARFPCDFRTSGLEDWKEREP
jgi:hypothetical protein